MVNNSFLCHFPSHYLLRMNSRIQRPAVPDWNVNFLLPFVARSLGRVYLAITFLTFFVLWKWIPALESLMNAVILSMQTKNAVPFPPHRPPPSCEFFHLITHPGCVLSTGWRGCLLACGLPFCGFIKLCLRFSSFRQSSFEGMEDTGKPNARERRFHEDVVATA